MKEKTEFLSNKPSGKDLFDGQSQEKVAEAIKQHINDIDSKPTPKSEQEADKALPRIIGIEGSWGSGKSNTILQLQEKLQNDYYFFTYDAWVEAREYRMWMPATGRFIVLFLQDVSV